MKQLLIYVNPNGFDAESAKLIKIQIDNSFELGWKKEDIVLVTNFPYCYEGIKPYIIDRGYCEFDKEASKFPVIDYLFDINFFEDGIYWCHDLDAYQLEEITEEELELTDFDAGFNDYCRAPRWQLGSFFFTKSAGSIFKEVNRRIKPRVDGDGKIKDDGTPLDEVALMSMTDENWMNINSRIKRINIRYDFGMRRVDYCFEKAIKPLKVLHFYPRNPNINTLKIAMYGKNRINKPLMNKRLIKIFNKYGYV